MIINASQYSLPGGENYLPAVETTQLAYMTESIDGVPAAFPPGTTDFSVVPKEHARMLGKWANHHQLSRLIIDIEYTGNPSTEVWHCQDPAMRPQAIELWKQYLEEVLRNYFGPLYIYDQCGTFQEYARVMIEDPSRQDEMFDMDDQYNRDMLVLFRDGYVTCWMPSLYGAYYLSDPDISIETKMGRWQTAKEATLKSLRYYSTGMVGCFISAWLDGKDADRWILPWRLHKLKQDTTMLWTGKDLPWTEFQQGAIYEAVLCQP